MLPRRPLLPVLAASIVIGLASCPALGQSSPSPPPAHGTSTALAKALAVWVGGGIVLAAALALRLARRGRGPGGSPARRPAPLATRAVDAAAVVVLGVAPIAALLSTMLTGSDRDMQSAALALVVLGVAALAVSAWRREPSSTLLALPALTLLAFLAIGALRGDAVTEPGALAKAYGPARHLSWEIRHAALPWSVGAGGAAAALALTGVLLAYRARRDVALGGVLRRALGLLAGLASLGLVVVAGKAGASAAIDVDKTWVGGLPAFVSLVAVFLGGAALPGEGDEQKREEAKANVIAAAGMGVASVLAAAVATAIGNVDLSASVEQDVVRAAIAAPAKLDARLGWGALFVLPVIVAAVCTVPRRAPTAARVLHAPVLGIAGALLLLGAARAATRNLLSTIADVGSDPSMILEPPSGPGETRR